MTVNGLSLGRLEVIVERAWGLIVAVSTITGTPAPARALEAARDASNPLAVEPPEGFSQRYMWASSKATSEVYIPRRAG